MKVATQVCELCRQEVCSGQIFRTKSRTATYASVILCESDEHVRKRDGKFYVHTIRAHGDEWDDELEEIRLPVLLRIFIRQRLLIGRYRGRIFTSIRIPYDLLKL